jgi:hypothetical protein
MEGAECIPPRRLDHRRCERQTSAIINCWEKEQTEGDYYYYCETISKLHLTKYLTPEQPNPDRILVDLLPPPTRFLHTREYFVKARPHRSLLFLTSDLIALSWVCPGVNICQPKNKRAKHPNTTERYSYTLMNSSLYPQNHQAAKKKARSFRKNHIKSSWCLLLELLFSPLHP